MTKKRARPTRRKRGKGAKKHYNELTDKHKHFSWLFILFIFFTISFFIFRPYLSMAITWPSPPSGEDAGGIIGNYIDALEDVIYVDSGKVGIGTTTPQATLEVVGVMKAANEIIIGNSTSTTAGTMRWSGTDFEGYDGSGWDILGNVVLVPTVTSVTPSTSLKSGESVTIVGTNFYKTSVVQIGDNDASNVSVVSSTTITAQTPSLLIGEHDVTVINPRWDTGTLSDGFEYTFECGVNTVEDVEGNAYSTVLIGSQCWMAEDMRTTKYPDNSAITKGPIADGDVAWTTDNAYYSCPPNVSNNGEDCAAASTFGMLYQWSAAMNGSTSEGAQGICPNGWHIPTDAESKILIESQATQGCEIDDGEWYCSPAGDKLKIAADCSGSSDCGTSGFEKLISGYRSNGDYVYRGDFTQFWASTESGSSARRRSFYNLYSTVVWALAGKQTGNSVRCIKDN